jgi:hypothetical protein
VTKAILHPTLSIRSLLFIKQELRPVDDLSGGLLAYSYSYSFSVASAGGLHSTTHGEEAPDLVIHNFFVYISTTHLPLLSHNGSCTFFGVGE